MNPDMQKRPDHGFVAGLLTGTCLGAGLAMWFAPRSAAELRSRVTEAGRRLGQRASEQYQQASARAGALAEDLSRKGQGVRDDVAQAVARGAREVERYATARSSSAAQ